MGVQGRLNNDNTPFILRGTGFTKNNETLLTDGGRVGDLVQYTLLARLVATGKWVPFTSEVVVETGASVPQGIYVGDDIAEADIQAGDVEQLSVLVGGNLTYDDTKLVIENGKLLTTPIKATTAVDNVIVQTVEDFLEDKGMFADSVVDIASFENA